MSLKRSKDVLQLVEKYRAKYPQLDRDLLRRLIRLENPDIFLKEKNKNYGNNLKTLDRYLRKAFETRPPSRSNELSRQPNLKKTFVDDLVEKALQKLAKEQRDTTMEEVASEVGIPPSNIELLVYRLIQKYGWMTSKTGLGEVKIDFKKPVDINAFKFGPVHNAWRPHA
jgi:hypothetical protein